MLPIDSGPCVVIGATPLPEAFGVIGLTVLLTLISGDSLLVLESTVRGEADGDGIAGIYGL